MPHSLLTTPEDRVYSRCLALLDQVMPLPSQLRAWHRAAFSKTLLDRREGSLSPATLALKLRHDEGEASLLEAVATACACFHTAADLADDCEDDDLPADTWSAHDRPHAINVSSGLLFLVYQAVANLPINDARRRAIHEVFTNAGWLMHVGQYEDLASTNHPTAADHGRISRLKTGAELGAFFAAAAIALGRPPEPYRHFGEAFGGLIQAISDVIDVWVKPESPDLLAGKQGLPIAVALAAGGEQVRLALAGNRSGADQQRRLRQVLCQPEVIVAWQEMATTLTADMMAALDEMPSPEPELATLAAATAAQAGDLATALAEAAPELRRASEHASPSASLPATDRAIRFLNEHGPLFRESWDNHRWGLFDQQEVIGDLFGPAIIADVLTSVGQPCPEVVDHVIARCDTDGWRYFPGQKMTACDADDLGQMMTLLIAHGGQAGRAAIDRALAAALPYCQAIGRLPVWIYTDETAVAPGSWPGDDCAGSIASGLYGLAQLNLPAWQPILTATVNNLLAAVGADGLWRSFMYPAPYVCTQLVVRGLLAQRPYCTVDLQARIDTALAEVRTHLSQTQRLDGGWGSPQESAAALSCWLLLGADPVGVQAAVAYLEGFQLTDGSWPMEPFFVTTCPTTPPPMFSSRLLTTALCLRALVQARNASIQGVGKPVQTVSVPV